MKIVIEGFGGEQPRVSAKLLDDNRAQEAQNCKLFRGTLEPWNEPASASDSLSLSSPKTIFYYRNKHWFEWDADVDVIRSPIARDDYQRVYYTGDGKPKKTDSSVATSSTPYPDTAYLMEVPKPDNAPEVSVADSSDEANVEATAYVVTFVSDYGEEGQPSDASEVVDMQFKSRDIQDVDTDEDAIDIDGDGRDDWGEDDTVAIVDSTGNDGDYTIASVSYDEDSDTTTIGFNESISDSTADGELRTRVELSDIPTTPSGDYNLDKVRIYRYHAGSTNGEYVLVGEVSIGTSDYTDTTVPQELGEVLPTAEYNTPPEDMEGLVIMANGVAAGFSGNEVCLSEPFLPYTYPSEYRQSTDYPIVGLGAFGTTLVVLTEGSPYILTGVDPASMTMEELGLPQACVSKRGIVSIQGGVIYPSPDGLVMVGEGGPRILTRDILTRDQWQDYNPSSIHAYYHDNRYHGFYDDGSTQAGFIFDPQDPQNTWTDVDTYATAGYADLETDTLYLVEDGELVKWDQGDDPMTFRWRSKVFQPKGAVNFTCGRIVAASYDKLFFRLYVDGQLALEQQVRSDAIFRLPSGFRAREWEIELEGEDPVDWVAIASSPTEIG